MSDSIPAQPPNCPPGFTWKAAHAHIAALTAERDALRAGVHALAKEMAARAAKDYALGRVQAAGPIALYARKLRALMRSSR